jgi:hypothetical protein
MRTHSSFGAHRSTTNGTTPTLLSLIGLTLLELGNFSASRSGALGQLCFRRMLRRRFLTLLGLAACNRSAKRTTPMANSSPRMPVLFVGHGSPMNAIEDNPWSRAFRALGTSLPDPGRSSRSRRTGSCPAPS